MIWAWNVRKGGTKSLNHFLLYTLLKLVNTKAFLYAKYNNRSLDNVLMSNYAQLLVHIILFLKPLDPIQYKYISISTECGQIIAS